MGLLTLEWLAHRNPCIISKQVYKCSGSLRFLPFGCFLETRLFWREKYLDVKRRRGEPTKNLKIPSAKIIFFFFDFFCVNSTQLNSDENRPKTRKTRRTASTRSSSDAAVALASSRPPPTSSRQPHRCSTTTTTTTCRAAANSCTCSPPAT